VISRSTRRWSRVAFYLFLIAIVLPTQLGVVPLYIGARAIGLTGSPFGMILLYTGMLLPLSIFIYAGFFRGMGTEYEEAAAIDGASRTQIFFRIVFPLMAPATGTVSIFAGLIVWNDFFNALIFLGGSTNQTLPVSMYFFIGSLVSKWNSIFAIVIISMIPILAFYLFAQKRFMQGFAGGLKG
jgi:raffinose/stachyose/melibiose transport system permease protein